MRATSKHLSSGRTFLWRPGYAPTFHLNFTAAPTLRYWQDERLRVLPNFRLARYPGRTAFSTFVVTTSAVVRFAPILR